MPGLKALLFDVDGTLAETERDGHRVAFNRAFQEHGLSWRWDAELYGELLAITGGRERLLHYARREHPQWMQQDYATAQIAQMHRNKNRHYADLVATGEISLRPGLEALLREAVSNNLQLAIVTTTSRVNVDALLASTLDGALREAFSVFVTGEDVTHKKPDPECYHLALRALGLAPDQALAVEDSPNGLQAASGAGILSLIVPGAYFRDADFTGAAFIADEFTDVSLPALRQTARR